MVTTAGGTERTPGDAVAGLRQTGERRFESPRSRQLRTGVELDVVKMQLRGDRRAHRELAVDIASGEAGRPLIDDKAGDALLDFCPHDCDISDRAVGDP